MSTVRWRLVWLAALAGAAIEVGLTLLGQLLGLLPLWLNLVRLALSPPSVIWIAFADATPFSKEVLVWQLIVAALNAALYALIAVLYVFSTRRR